MGITMCIYAWCLVVGASPLQGPKVRFTYNTITPFIFYLCFLTYPMSPLLVLSSAHYTLHICHVSFKYAGLPPFTSSFLSISCISGPHYLIIPCFSHVSAFVPTITPSVCRFPCFFTFHYYLIWTDPEWPILVPSLSCKP